MTSSSTTTPNPIREIAELGPLTLGQPLSKEEFYTLAGRYPDLRMEREKDGKTVIMSPVKFGSGTRESIALIYLGIWWIKHKRGKTFSPSSGIELPDGSIKSPDCGWISPERLARAKDEEAYLEVMPDFIVEIRSQSDQLAQLQLKMKEIWMANGARLGWLIDPYGEQAFVYREDGTVETISGFEGKTLSGEEVLPGMELPLEEFRVSK